MEKRLDNQTEYKPWNPRQYPGICWCGSWVWPNYWEGYGQCDEESCRNRTCNIAGKASGQIPKNRKSSIHEFSRLKEDINGGMCLTHGENTRIGVTESGQEDDISRMLEQAQVQAGHRAKKKSLLRWRRPK